MEDPGKIEKYIIEGLADLRHRAQELGSLRSAELDALESEKRQAEEALRESEAKFRAITGGSQIGVCIVQNGNYIYMNEKAEDITGYKYSELSRWEISDFLDIVHPDDRAILKKYIEKGMIKGTNISTYRIRSGSGRVKWIDHYSSIINYDGKPAALLVIEDVTARREAEDALHSSEEKLKKTFYSTSVLIFVAGYPEGCLIDVNDTFEEYTGFSREEVMGKTPVELGIFKVEDNKIFLELLKNNGIVNNEPFTIRRKSGESASALFSAQKMSLDGKSCIVASAADITTRKWAEAFMLLQHELGIALSSVRDSREAAAIVLDTAVSIEGVDCAQIFIREPGTGAFRHIHSKRLPIDFTDMNSAPGSESMAAKIMMKGRPYYTVYDSGAPFASSDANILAVGIIPFLHKREITGYLCAASFTQDEFSLNSRSALETIASQAAGTISRLQAEEALRRSEDVWRFLVENTPNFITVVGKDGTIRYINHDIQNVLLADVIGKSAFSYVQPNCRAVYSRALEDVFNNEGTGSFEVDTIAPDGNVYIFDNYYSPVKKDGVVTDMMLISINVTERKKFEQALRESEKRFGRIVSNVPGVVFQFVVRPDETFDLPYINDRLYYQYGIKPEDVIGNPDKFISLLHPDFIESTMSKLLNTSKNLTLFDHEVRVVLGGEERWGRIYGNPEKQPNGDVIWYALIVDITDLKQAEAALRESEKKYRTILENIEDVYYRTDIKGNLLFTSESGKKLFGYNYETENINIMRDLYRDENQKRDFLKELFDRGSVRNFAIRLTGRDGSEIIGETNSHIIYDESGKPAGVEGIVRDITERVKAGEELRKSEAKFRSYVENAYDIVYSLDLKGNFNYISPNWSEYFSYKADDIIGKSPLDYIHPDDILKCQAFFRNVIKSREKQGGIEYRARDRYGKWRWYITNASPIKDENGSPVSFIGISHDITERRELVTRLEEKTKELGSFVYTVSHDLKAPLVSLEGFSSLLSKEYGDKLEGQGRHYLERIKYNVVHMERLILDLLDLSRIGRIAGERSAVDIEDVIDEIRQEFQLKLRERNVRLSLHGPLPKPYGDRERIKQVFENLISNAIKFMGDRDDCCIEVGAVNGSGEDNFFCFYVRDNGIGIDKKYFGNIFQIFHRLKDVETEGTGVGLTIVKKIIEHHGGRIWIDSAVGRGSTFYFTLPAGVS